MKRSGMKRFFALVLLFVTLMQICALPSMASGGVQQLTERMELEEKIRYFYKASLDYAEKDSFNGYCAFYVNTQLYLLGINRTYVGGNGNDEFDNYRYLKKSNGGYDIAAYPARSYTLWSALNAISGGGKKDVYNILVGFQRGVSAAGRKYGHTCFIHGIVDGWVYFSDSMTVKMNGNVYPEGTPIRCSIQDFCTYYRPWTLDGVIHFTYDKNHICKEGKVLFQESAHPHCNYFQCRQCGQVMKDIGHPNYKKDCARCNIPGTAQLEPMEKYYLTGENQYFTFEESKLTTAYDLILECKVGGKYAEFDVYRVKPGTHTLTLPQGSYRAKIRSWNENGVSQTGSGPAWADGPWVTFQVVAVWDCNAYGHVFDTVETVKATCTEKGKRSSHCIRCNQVIEETLYPLGHRYLSQVTTKQPSETEPGLATTTCTSCGKMQEIPLPELKRNPFVDVKAGDYFYAPVVSAFEDQITAGVSDTAFAPNSRANRGQVVTFLWRLAGSPKPETTLENCPFTDLDPEEYYVDAVLWAVEKGITQGIGRDRFAPTHRVTRGQFVTFLYRLAGEPKTECGTVFEDTKTRDYYTDALLWATRNSIANGVTETRFSPEGSCTRGQIVTFIYRYRNWSGDENP